MVLALTGRRAVIIGDGGAGATLAALLLELGAAVTLVAVDSPDTARSLGIGDSVTCLPRAYVRGDLAGAFIAVCFDGGEIAAAVAAEAVATSCLVNIVDRPELSTFRFAESFAPSPSVEERA